MALVSLLPHTDQQEKLALLGLFELMAKNDPSVLEASISQLLAYLCPNTANNNVSGCVCVGVLKVVLCVAQRKPTLLVEHLATLHRAATPPHATPHHVILIAQILAQVGKLNKVPVTNYFFSIVAGNWQLKFFACANTLPESPVYENTIVILLFLPFFSCIL